MNNKDSKNELLLGLLNDYRDALRLQRGVTDRWFRYYLLIVGIPFIILGALSGREITPTMQTLIGLRSMAAVSLFLFFVGLFFLLMNTHQRENSLGLMKKMFSIEKLMHEKLGMPYSPPPIKPHGADFYVGLVQIFINSSWLFLFVYLMCLNCGKCELKSLMLALVSFFVMAGLQFWQRDKLLEKAEERQGLVARIKAKITKFDG